MDCRRCSYNNKAGKLLFAKWWHSALAPQTHTQSQTNTDRHTDTSRTKAQAQTQTRTHMRTRTVLPAGKREHQHCGRKRERDLEQGLRTGKTGDTNRGALQKGKGTREGKEKKRTHRLQPDSLPDARVGGVEDSTGAPGRVHALLAHWMVRKLCNTRHQSTGTV